MRPKNDALREAFPYLGEQIDRFREILEASVFISDGTIGIEHTGRQNRALFVFAKLIAHNMTILSCFEQVEANPRSFLDHFSVATLGRASLDAALMTMYISHPGMTREQWQLRRKVLILHDLTNRKRFLTSGIKLSATPVEPPPVLKNYESGKEKLRQEIARFAAALGITSTERLDALKSGNLVFVDGVRGVVREAGWSVDAYEHFSSYWSAFVHSHPVSFMRADEHGISFDAASDFQLGFCATVLDYVASTTAEVNTRMTAFTGAIERDLFGDIL